MHLHQPYHMSKETTLTTEQAIRVRQQLSHMYEPLLEHEIAIRLKTWLLSFDRAQNVESKSGVLLGLNNMHVTGMHLCAQVHNLQPQAYTHFDVQQVYAKAPRLRVHPERLQDMSWTQLQDVLTALQLELKDILRQESGHCHSQIDIGELLVCIMCRAGFFFANKWPSAGNVSDLAFAEVQGNAMHIEQNTAAQFLDCVHSIGSVASMLVQQQHLPELQLDSDTGPDTQTTLSAAQKIYGEICTNISEHHKEVTLDDFYEQSMVCDLYTGSITQYKHRHQAVFHSISQVVYFNWPAYARKRQAGFDEMMQTRAYVNLVPLLREMYPDIPLLYEHNGALHADTHAQYALAWVCVAGYWALVDANTQAFYAKDPIALLAHMLTRQAE